MNKILRCLSNFRFFHKMIIIYVVCVLFPMITVSMFYYNITIKKIKAEKAEELNYSVMTAKNTVNSYIDQVIMICYSITQNRNIYNELNDTNRDLPYYMMLAGKYDLLVNSYLINDNIENICFYCSNEKICKSPSIKILDDSVKESNWYIRFTESKSEMNIFLFDSEEDEDKKSLCLVSKLQIGSSLKNDTLVKIDLNFEYIENVLEKLSMSGDAFLLDENNRIIAAESIGDDVKKYKNKEFQYHGEGVITAELDFPIGYKIVGRINPELYSEIFGRETLIFIMISLLNLILATFVIELITKTITRKLGQLTHCSEKLKNQQFELVDETDIGSDEIGILITGFNQAITKMKFLINEVYEQKLIKEKIENEKNAAEMRALQSQINPHFLFNMLESIRMKSIIKGEVETAGIIKNVSQIFRRTISWGEDIIAIKEEMEFIDNYVSIQKYRFDDEINIEMSVNEDILTQKVPKMSIQIFVENVFVHGFKNSTGNNIMKLKIARDGNRVLIEIYDNGSGIEPEKINAILKGEDCKNDDKHKSVGIKNVIKRMELYYGEQFDINIDSKVGEMTMIRLRIPFIL